MSLELTQAVHDAVISCVRRVGHTRVDIRMIAREAGCSTGAVYTVAPTKSELLAQVRSDLIGSYEQFLESLVPLPSVDAYFDVVARGWERDHELGLFTSSFVDVRHTGRIPQHWLELSAAAGTVPPLAERSKEYWDEFMAVSAAVLGNLAASEPALIGSLVRDYGPQLQSWVADAMDLEPVEVGGHVQEWVLNNRSPLRFEDPMVSALFTVKVVEDDPDPAVGAIAERAGTSTSSVYRAGGVLALEARMVDLINVQLAAGLETFDSVADRCLAMTLRQTNLILDHPAIMSSWANLRRTPVLRSTRATTYFHDWLSHQIAIGRATGELQPDAVELSQLIPAFFVGPIQMWATQPGYEKRIFEWALRCTTLFSVP